ncbi:hypothetical protein [Weissella confusa]
MEIKPLERKDFGKIQRFAITGMHLSRYTSNRFELYFYAKYFWYLELLRATRIYAAYEGGADVKIMDRFFRHREVPDSENFSKPGFQLKKASFLGVFVGRTGPRPAGERKQVV